MVRAIFQYLSYPEGKDISKVKILGGFKPHHYPIKFILQKTLNIGFIY